MSRIKWKIRNILKDGRILQPSEGLPVTEASLEAFRQYGEIALKATLQEEAPTEQGSFSDYLGFDYIPRHRRQVAVKSARMEPYPW